MSSQQYCEAHYKVSRALNTATTTINDMIVNAVDKVHKFAENHPTTTKVVSHSVVAVVSVVATKATICKCITNCNCG
ncbi:22517_t:CDS:2 [Entrophospora sp. SA101]|nr:14896_t:CDS:2 [Entrophospora sp. SA101]CAJ0754448.1 22517_t:CDS:2 [Entrophospora sp. SA101]CAJ0844487.1 4042_t:CDS:2 [Entrophospora sp. SA101]CAJ0870153.1 17165_t:CDS:2 [Entrophospora sp. SA101]CAJ0913307.1 4446_t:CDS:2 [Entrophospora sp. SA101]